MAGSTCPVFMLKHSRIIPRVTRDLLRLIRCEFPFAVIEFGEFEVWSGDIFDVNFPWPELDFIILIIEREIPHC